MNTELAIVIPAYKERFIARTLQSIAQQTDRRFRVYIGDDCGPAGLETAARSSSNLGEVCYHRFAENLGGRSLVQHWTRCIRLSREPWVWLFSDDDLLEPGCVAAFFATLQATGGAYDAYRFSSVEIDRNDRLTRVNPRHPRVESSMEFAYFLLQGLRRSYAQEVIYSRAAFDDLHGLVDFPHAWGSDHATLMSIGARKGICAVEGPRIRFRQSGENLSSRRSNKDVPGKIAGVMGFISWLREFRVEHSDPTFPLPPDRFDRIAREWYFGHLSAFHHFFTPGECWRLSRFASESWKEPWWLNAARMVKMNLAAIYHGCRRTLRPPA